MKVEDFYSQIKSAEFATLEEAKVWANATMANTKYVVASRIQPFTKVLHTNQGAQGVSVQAYRQYYLVTIIYRINIKK